MSHDVYLEKPDGSQTLWHNYTYNISPMLRLAWDGAGMNDLDGKTARAAAPLLAAAIVSMTNDPKRFDVLNPENGWGNRDGCVEWLQGILDDCLSFPRAKVRGT